MSSLNSLIPFPDEPATHEDVAAVAKVIDKAEYLFNAAETPDAWF